MTLAADAVTDEDVARLIKRYGEKQVVAMVLLLAYANFQDRLVLTLGLSAEKGDLVPREMHFVHGAEDPAVPPRNPPKGVVPRAAARLGGDEWDKLDFTGLQGRLEKQRERPPRIAVPAWDDVRHCLPKDYPANRPTRIKWSLVCLGYQPELTAAWLSCMRTFGSEAKQDRVFEESLFWVVTRSLHCFY